MELNVDENEVLTAMLLCNCKKVENAQKIGKLEYEKVIISLYSIVTYASLIQSVVFTLLAPYIINILYGANYIESVTVLQVIVWYCTFSYLGGARDIWILAENKQKLLPIINLCGMLLNIVLNIIIMSSLQVKLLE